MKGDDFMDKLDVHFINDAKKCTDDIRVQGIIFAANEYQRLLLEKRMEKFFNSKKGKEWMNKFKQKNQNKD